MSRHVFPPSAGVVHDVQLDRKRVHSLVGEPIGQETPVAVDRGHLLVVLPVHRSNRTIVRPQCVQQLRETDIVFLDLVHIVAGSHADRMDPHERSVSHEVRIRAPPPSP